MNKWDSYFLSICKAVGSNSKCLSRKIGSILVKDKVIICTGYNGPPRGVPHCDESKGDVRNLRTVGVCPRRLAGHASGKGLHLCPAAHAERNTIDQAARLGICTSGATLYLDTQVPCKDCLISIIQAGIFEVVCTELRHYDLKTEFILEHSKLKIRTFNLEA